jgi:hypothetical protein
MIRKHPRLRILRRRHSSATIAAMHPRHVMHQLHLHRRVVAIPLLVSSARRAQVPPALFLRLQQQLRITRLRRASCPRGDLIHLQILNLGVGHTYAGSGPSRRDVSFAAAASRVSCTGETTS